MAIYKNIVAKHIEWAVLFIGLLLLAAMNPYIQNGPTLCLLELAGIPYCPGEGLGHSIAFTFRGELGSAFKAHFMGPAAVLILTGRITFIWFNMLFKNNNPRLTEKQNGKTD